jgi:4-hydroxy-tetrahydrodipicolinate reductase
MQIGILGYSGKMGQKVDEEITKMGWSALGLSKDVHELNNQLKTVDAVIEFSSEKGIESLLELADCPLVLAATGLSEDIKEKIIEKSLAVPVFYSANYSMGLFELIHILKTSSLNHATAFISETHHIHKKDAPSGTALMLKQALGVETEIHSSRYGEVFGITNLFCFYP